ncbi:hypothetical protein [Leucobacter salsicius]|uniref:hypothetical protein n=1 Tax=Leucobacter salsicius TaxID=664638 RepID=UPI001E47337F|nr:hypothetical protein [Leucobacter salsicius]
MAHERCTYPAPARAGARPHIDQMPMWLLGMFPEARSPKRLQGCEPGAADAPQHTRKRNRAAHGVRAMSGRLPQSDTQHPVSKRINRYIGIAEPGDANTPREVVPDFAIPLRSIFGHHLTNDRLVTKGARDHAHRLSEAVRLNGSYLHSFSSLAPIIG